MSDSSFTATEFLDLSRTVHGELFRKGEPVWNALSRIAPYLAERLTDPSTEGAVVSEQASIGPQVHLEEGVTVEPFVNIQGPAWIGPGTTIRSGAYLRPNVIAGAGVTLGNSCEFKNCLLFDGVQVPHFNYVGDSLLGHDAHLGAGVILSNVRLDRQDVIVTAAGQRISTGLRKFGAVVGDRTEVGCNAVLSPGSLLGRDCILYPGSQWRGYLPSSHVLKLTQQQTLIEQRKRS